jgi:elongation factor G-like protein
VEVFADEALADSICAELESRNATIDTIDRDLPRGIAVRAFVTADDLRGFGERFDAFATGTATYTTRFSHYAGRGERDAGARS